MKWLLVFQGSFWPGGLNGTIKDVYLNYARLEIRDFLQWQRCLYQGVIWTFPGYFQEQFHCPGSGSEGDREGRTKRMISATSRCVGLHFLSYLEKDKYRWDENSQHMYLLYLGAFLLHDSPKMLALPHVQLKPLHEQQEYNQNLMMGVSRQKQGSPILTGLWPQARWRRKVKSLYFYHLDMFKGFFFPFSNYG